MTIITHTERKKCFIEDVRLYPDGKLRCSVCDHEMDKNWLLRVKKSQPKTLVMMVEKNLEKIA